eukprot:1152905-Ditylum_brightwellii.AAC.1
MYDSCGFNHCSRLTSNVYTLWEHVGNDKKKRERAIKEAGLQQQRPSSALPERQLALWLWEVHNAVNVRIMKEAAERENRNVTEEEKLSALFPPLDLCEECWVDEDMAEWDEEVVFRFLKRWYW